MCVCAGNWSCEPGKQQHLGVCVCVRCSITYECMRASACLACMGNSVEAQGDLVSLLYRTYLSMNSACSEFCFHKNCSTMKVRNAVIVPTGGNI